MAITILKEPSVQTPSGAYPAYNDSFIEFTSDLAGNNRAEITLTPSETFPKPFVIYPDLDGEYLFNMKEAVKVVLNSNGFSDSAFFDDQYFKTVGTNFLSQDVSIEVFNDTTSEVVGKNYSFYKAVNQIGEKIFENGYSLLNTSKNGIDYNLTYFEGFPFHFEFKRVFFTEETDIKIVNKNTGQSVRTPTTGNGTFRVNIDLSDGKNWTSDSVLPLNVGLNRLEVLHYLTEGEIDSTFLTNINIKKVKKKSGVYLKWRNNQGGFSHRLFDQFFTDTLRGRDIDTISSGKFENVGSVTSSFRSTGKVATEVLRLKTICDANESEELKSLFISPLIQMYTSREANVKGEYIDVRVEQTFNFRSKKENQQFFLTVGLPEVQTLRL